MRMTAKMTASQTKSSLEAGAAALDKSSTCTSVNVKKTIYFLLTIYTNLIELVLNRKQHIVVYIV